MHFRTRLVGLILTTALATAPAVASPAGAFANDGEITTQEVATALKSIPGLLAQSDTIKSKSDSRAVITTTKSTSTSVPKDASTGVTVKGNSSSFTISLPNADINGTGKQVAPGVIAYSGEDGSTNAVQTNEDGSVRMLTVIDSASAPIEYTYGITVPSGGKITLTKEGGALVLDKRGKFVAFAAKPWAKDAHGQAVPTRYTTNDTTLTQVVEHNRSGIVYPVVADPSFHFKWTGVDVYFNRSESDFIARVGATAIPGLVRFSGATGFFVGGVIAAIADAARDAFRRSGYCVGAWKAYFGSGFTVWLYRC